MKLPKDFPLTQRELKAALSSRYWCVSGYGTKEHGLCPIGIVAKLRGVPFEIRCFMFMPKKVSEQGIEKTMTKADTDTVHAFGFDDYYSFLDALERRGSRLKHTVIARLKRKGVTL